MTLWQRGRKARSRRGITPTAHTERTVKGEPKVIVPSPHTVVVLEHNGDGALERVPESATAFGSRGWPYNCVVTSAWSNADDTERNVRWTRELFDAMRPFMADASYVNYLGGDEEAEGLRAAYGSKFERLSLLKLKYDPRNLFRMNQNVRPAGAGAGI